MTTKTAKPKSKAASGDTRVAYEDIREWIDALEAEGQLTRVQGEVDWKYELGSIVRRT